jgi:predicted RNA-binding Zn ribbon-like protein
MGMTGSAAATMKLVGGDPCLDFVNTVGGRPPAGAKGGSEVRNDKLGRYLDLVAWARHVGVIGETHGRRLAGGAQRRPGEAARVLGRATRFRESLYRALRAIMKGARPDPTDLEVLNAEITAARGRERLVPGAEGLRWEAAGRAEGLESVLWPVCRAAAGLLTSGDLLRLRQCAGEGCGWLFLDRSRNRSRQWCAMEDCGNVSKVRRFRQRRRRRFGET